MSRPPEVDWFWNSLIVSGPEKPLAGFIDTAQGPGFVPWRRDEAGDWEFWSALLLQGGAPSPAAAEKLAQRYRETLWLIIEDARAAAERGYPMLPLDLNALLPVPPAVLKAGYRQGGAEWCRRH